MKQTMLIGAFDSPEKADDAIDQLEGMGYSASEISVIARGETTGMMRRVEGPTPGERIAEGAAAGGAIGGVAGLIAGALGLIVIGPIAALLGLTGIAATTVTGAVVGAATGGIVGALTSLGVSEETARSYEETVRAGGVILAVPVKEHGAERIRRVLEDNGAQGTSEIEAEM